ncbi:MAG: DNA mismatch repair endonuclease MutL, partial [Mycoplasmatales bacterium]
KTLGFRGEALPSIFAVAQLAIVSSKTGQSGYKLTKVSENDFKVEEYGANKGTRITVENLFYNTPVRYKHLSTTFYELSIIVQYINRLSLIHPEISFELINDQKQLIITNGDNNIQAIFANIYNNEFSKKLLINSVQNDHFTVDLFLGHPLFTRSRNTHIVLTINGRLIKNYQIEQQILKSYGQFLHTNQFPIVLINIKVNHSLVDVNIHPTKQQVKISLIEDLLSVISSGITEALEQISFIGEVNFSNKTSISYNNPNNRKISEVEQLNSKRVSDLYPENSEKIAVVGKQQAFEIKQSNPVSMNEQQLSEFEKELDEIFRESQTPVQTKLAEETNVYEEQITSNQKSRFIFTNLSYLASFHNTFLLFEYDACLYLIDQHAAQERIKYEQILEKLTTKKFNYQIMLVPFILDFTQDEFALIKDQISQFENFGIKVEIFGINTLKITEMDDFVAKYQLDEHQLRQISSLIIEKNEDNYEMLVDKIAIMMACKQSIKAHHFLQAEEVKNLLVQLDQAIQPFTCPHGRPIMTKITLSELEKLFKRTN